MLVRPLAFLLPLVLAGTQAAHAAAPEPKPEPEPEPAAAPDADAEPEAPLIPDAPDKLSGHFVLGAGAGFATQFGQLKSGTNATTLGLGLNTVLDLGIGVGRHVTIGVFGEFAMYPAKRCVDCDATSYGVGPFIRYHVVQGTRFDPWMLLAAGYRHYSAEGPMVVGSTELEPVKRSFNGIEWAHLVLGADFYVFQNFAFGPWFEITGGSVVHEPLPIEIDNRTLTERNWQNYGCFSGGIRLVFDVPGK